MHEEGRSEVARFMRRLYRQGLTTTSGGNLSMRTADGHVLLTGSKSDKGLLRPAQVGVLTVAGENLTPEVVPSIEAGMHLELYRRYPAVRAVVHAHPPCSSAFAATELRVNTRLLAESYALLGEPAVAPYALMGTPALAEAVAIAAAGSRCVVLENHGVLTTGATLLEAFDRLEVFEFAARLTLLARLLGGGRELTLAQKAELDLVMGRYVPASMPEPAPLPRAAPAAADGPSLLA